MNELHYCYNFKTYIYKAQCCAICFEKLKCHGSDINFTLPHGISKLKRTLPMGNTNNVKFDLEQLYNSMLESGLDPQKSMMELSSDDMQLLGHCYFASTVAASAATADINIDEEIPF
jgi:hypothetical protein